MLPPVGDRRNLRAIYMESGAIAAKFTPKSGEGSRRERLVAFL
jgi:hypothetical protein